MITTMNYKNSAVHCKANHDLKQMYVIFLYVINL